MPINLKKQLRYQIRSPRSAPKLLVLFWVGFVVLEVVPLSKSKSLITFEEFVLLFPV